ncbi:lipopolysaccharide transport periplasmic protein LptA [Coxiella burnetii]|uniref:Organic solvent tolerance-like N-terminal domain-containing protein n=1 Tax=Coxiella burnetii (strain Dugway 5J108-111) TaxID=434922 RepID=A9KDT4_COXBN|nr:lipopolysaccharide transport periplasmic protein LptA [Coxiella burnetii]ABX78258.1 cell envelope biogenesis protein YhbN [Coxiella burnetii RSA 331]EAX32202.2 lipopolysaccharide transport periplasmic protein LptA [Coxiella burnetii 'MSU Goat Q177']ABS77934.1 hypothetical protein CBUD_0760 [Coxiella burnetii Dugway 5J108-111]AIT63743.1 Cell envelope biogenesis protein YhbN [Coxiella burnetii str. Namibia]AML49352.1 lipopolysaccharide transport periplasmic protein LptA [Coxiella burnetii]
MKSSQHRGKRIPNQIALLLLTGLPLLAVALSSDQFKPYHVRSIEVIYRRPDHITLYHGDVYATQGTTWISGDKVIVYHNPTTNRIVRLKAIGHPAHYSTMPDNQKARLYAQAETILYFPAKAQVLLIKNARVTQKQNILTGPHIWYDIKKQTVISTVPNGKGNTTVVIEPQ